MKSKIIDLARHAGFYKAGIAPIRLYTELLPLLEKRGDTPFVKTDMHKRINPYLYLKTARSAIVCLLPYIEGNKMENAKYARGEDYHTVIKEGLKYIAEGLGLERYKLLVDTGGLPDRYLAYLAGLGWYGMNNLLYTDGLGSRFYIGTILCEKAIDADSPVKNRCIKCSECIKACPSNALGDDFHFDPTRCISYLTQKDELNQEEKKFVSMGKYKLGCDICQDVCPMNREGTYNA